MQQRYYDPHVGRFLGVDSMASDTTSGWNFNRYNYAANNSYKFTDPDGRFADILLDAGFIAYDIYSLATNPSWTAAAALGLDVAGAAIPFVTGLGQAYRAADKLVDVAKAAESATVRTGKAAQDGVQIHKKFDAAINGGAAKNVSGESAYLNGKSVDGYRPKGSSNPDAVLGNPNNPIATFDLKTGKSGISSAQAAKASKNLPSGVPMYEVRATGHNVPRPATGSGVGAAINIVCNSTESCP